MIASLKSQRTKDLRHQLEVRGLSTDGLRPVLTERLCNAILGLSADTDDLQGLATPKKKSRKKGSRRPSDADAGMGRQRSASNSSNVGRERSGSNMSTVSINGTPEVRMCLRCQVIRVCSSVVLICNYVVDRVLMRLFFCVRIYN